MLKKSEVIEALNNGGHIHIEEIYRTARVYDVEGDELGTCRYDTAERIGNAEGYKSESCGAWTYARHITKESNQEEPTQDTQPATAANIETEEQTMNTNETPKNELLNAAKEACTDALRAFERAGIISDLHIEPLNAEQCAAICARAEAAANAESERVRAAVAANLPGLVEDEPAQDAQPEPAQEPETDTAPDYLDERWPTSNAAPVVLVAPGMYKPGVYYSVEHRTPGSACAMYSTAETVDDLETLVQQIRNDGSRIGHAWRVDRSTGTRREFIPETRQDRTNRENRETCRRISDELDAYAQGRAYRCPDCGEVIEIDDLDELETENEDGATVYRLPCGCETEYEPEQLSLYDYFTDALDIEYRCDSRREYRSVSVMVTCGGPNIYIDTDENAVLLYWWGDRARYDLDRDTAAAVDEWAEEYWNCL